MKQDMHAFFVHYAHDEKGLIFTADYDIM